MEIKILGTGCPKCNKLESMVKEIVKESEADADISKVSSVKDIAKAGVMLTPALMVNGDVKFSGKVPSKEELAKVITAGEGK